MNVLHRDELKRGGFAGLRETRLVMDPRVFGHGAEENTWSGIGNFVYLADANFLPKGETHLHNHKEIDVISVMVDGRIAHEGSLEHGQEMGRSDAQAQRAGGEGFSHNEVNPDDTENRMIQLWVKPERMGDRASYKFYRPARGQLTRIYGGASDQAETLDSNTHIEVGLFDKDQTVSIEKPSLVYVTRGSGDANGHRVVDGNLIRSDALEFKAAEDVQLIAVYAN